LGLGSFLHILILAVTFSEIELGLNIGLKLLDVGIAHLPVLFAGFFRKSEALSYWPRDLMALAGAKSILCWDDIGAPPLVSDAGF
jgi:hypothetical protein